MKTILSVKEVKSLVDKLHQENKSIVVAGGCFDLLHIGHITLLENAKKEGDTLIVLVESDESIRQKKGVSRPIHTQQERAQLVGALAAVDCVVLLPAGMTNDTYDALLREISPSVIATTDNDQYLSHKERQAKLVGAKVVKVNKYIPTVSTTKLLSILSKEV